MSAAIWFANFLVKSTALSADLSYACKARRARKKTQIKNRI
jgi:hypothetical protein